ncbi:cytochrome P450 [Pseudorhodobacter sp. E13]|uniref:cytochrome P450 n=1 Tax=Pseudorhodobacter sp. E13 TaxID=2487931 RepID=UPI000F8CCAAE|nr:cytochrome P450 [Pseudorhodobacter sp. E13]RUS60008.1 cytochrome P450 [Pseudorhodobacter sp. E13]
MLTLAQSPRDPDFVQNPYAFYDRARAEGPFFQWQDYGKTCTTSYAAVNAILRDRRFGREIPADQRPEIAPHTAPFYAIEAHSMLELEPPRHTRLRSLVLRAFTSRRINALTPDITQLSHDLIDTLPDGPFNLLEHFGQRLPVTIIARLLGVPETMGSDLLRWSNAMVKMYIANRSRAIEDAAAEASRDFTDFMRRYIDARRSRPADDLITHLIAAEEDGQKLSTDEMISTCILLLNAGHEATVHSIGNGVKTLLETQTPIHSAPKDALIEELIRFDPPLHMFTRYAYEDVEVMGHLLPKGSEVALLLAAANRDPQAFDSPNQFTPQRPAKANLSFGAGLHFCIGAPLARLELQIALPILFDRQPNLHLTAPPTYADLYHFHGLEKLMVAA